MIMLSIQTLTKLYDGIPVVDDVTLDIPRGKVTSLIGPNGAGKSTVLGIATRLLASDHGNVLLDGKSIRQWNTRALARHLAVLTQSNNVQMKVTVRELVGFGRFPHSGTRLTADDHRRVDEAVRYMGLEDFADRFIDEMSGGQRQRAFIAMVLAQDTDVIFLDEPTNNLDIRHSLSMMKLLRRLADELGKTVIIVLHEINLASFYSDRICAFKDGKLAFSGTPAEVMTAERLKAVYGVDFRIVEIDGRPMALYH